MDLAQGPDNRSHGIGISWNPSLRRDVDLAMTACAGGTEDIVLWSAQSDANTIARSCQKAWRTLALMPDGDSNAYASLSVRAGMAADHPRERAVGRGSLHVRSRSSRRHGDATVCSRGRSHPDSLFLRVAASNVPFDYFLPLISGLRGAERRCTSSK